MSFEGLFNQADLYKKTPCHTDSWPPLLARSFATISCAASCASSCAAETLGGKAKVEQVYTVYSDVIMSN